MNDSIFLSIHSTNPPSHPGIYTDLADLVRLKFRTRGFSFLPRQPVHSILAGRHASQLRGRGQLLSELAYNPRLMTQLDTSAVEELFTIVRHCIRAHSAAAEIVATRS
jgi:hypothetical protein